MFTIRNLYVPGWPHLTLSVIPQNLLKVVVITVSPRVGVHAGHQPILTLLIVNCIKIASLEK